MTENVNIDPFASTGATENVYEKLVGDGKKFKDNESLARGKQEADAFIETLKNENAELRKKADQGMALEELYKRLSNQPAVGEPPVNEVNKPDATPPDIEKIIRETLGKTEMERTRTANQNLVTNTLNEVWGDKSPIEVEKAASALGITVGDLKEMGLRSPAALFKVLGIEKKNTPSGTTVPTSLVNVRNDISNGERTMKYYTKMMKENRKLFDDPKTQIQMNNDAIRIGPAFFD